MPKAFLIFIYKKQKWLSQKSLVMMSRLNHRDQYLFEFDNPCKNIDISCPNKNREQDDL